MALQVAAVVLEARGLGPLGQLLQGLVALVVQQMLQEVLQV